MGAQTVEREHLGKTMGSVINATEVRCSMVTLKVLLSVRHVHRDPTRGELILVIISHVDTNLKLSNHVYCKHICRRAKKYQHINKMIVYLFSFADIRDSINPLKTT